MTQSASFECTIEGRGDSPDIQPDIKSLRSRLRHSALSETELTTVDLGPRAREYANFFAPVELRVRLYDADGQPVDSERVFKGILTEIESEGQASNMTLKTAGRGWHLKNNESIVEFENIRVWEAIEQYLNEETDFEAEVVPDPGSPVLTDAVSFSVSSQQEWEALIEDSIPDDKPITVKNGALTTLPTAFVAEGESTSFLGINVVRADDNFSDGEAVGVGGPNVSFGDGFDITMPGAEYDLENWSLEIRNEFEPDFDNDGDGTLANETLVLEEEDPGRDAEAEVICDVTTSVGAGESATVEIEVRDDDGNILASDIATAEDDASATALIDRNDIDNFSVLEVTHTGDSNAEFDYIVRDRRTILPGFELEVNGETVANFADGASLFSADVAWAFNRQGSQTISAGQNINITLSVDSANVDFSTQDVDDYGYFIWDVVAVVDERFEYTFDNQTHEPEGHLDGPETHPDEVSFEFPIDERETQVAVARIDSTWDDIAGSQALAASNNAGGDYLSESNSESLDVDFSAEALVGTELRAKTTHGRHSPSGPREQTPRFGYAGQSIEEMELRFDQTSIAVIGSAGLLLSDTDLENLKTLCNLARFNFAIDHTADGKRIDAFPIGTEGESVDWDAKDWNRRDGDANYANRVVARGARKPEEEQEDEDDLRYEAVAVDDDEIERLMGLGLTEEEATISTVITDPELQSREEVAQQAFNNLEGFVERRLPTGNIDVVPTFIPPGFAYSIPQFEREGETPVKTLESIIFDQRYNSTRGSLEFEPVRNWVNAVTPIDNDVSGIKRLF